MEQRLPSASSFPNASERTAIDYGPRGSEGSDEAGAEWVVVVERAGSQAHAGETWDDLSIIQTNLEQTSPAHFASASGSAQQLSPLLISNLTFSAGDASSVGGTGSLEEGLAMLNALPGKAGGYGPDFLEQPGRVHVFRAETLSRQNHNGFGNGVLGG